MKFSKDFYPEPRIGDTRKRKKFCWFPFTFLRPHNSLKPDGSFSKETYWLETITIYERYTRESQLEESYWEITDVI